MATTATAIREILKSFGEPFASTADAVLDVWVGVAMSVHSSAPWGATYGSAMAFYAGHLVVTLGTDDDSGDAPGPVKSKKAGDVAESYATAASSSMADTAIAASKWGRAYLAIRGTRAARVGVVARVG